MSEALSSIGTALGSTGGKAALGLGTAGAGLIQNLIAYNKQKAIQDTLTNPAKLSAMVAKETQPLSAGLTADIARSTDAYGAERGLGSSPYIMRDVYAQALAPVEQQQQNAALQAVLSQLGMAQKGAMQPVDITSIFKALSGLPSSTSTYPTGVWTGGSVGGVSDPGLATPSYMPTGNWPGVTSSGTMDPFSMGQTMTLPTPIVDSGS